MKISAREIQVLAAGALALIGFEALLQAPHDLVVSQSLLLAGSCLGAGLALPIGVGIFLGSRQALFWARVYLLLGILGTAATLCFSVFPISARAPHLNWLRATSDLLIPIVLLGLLAWSNSGRPRISSTSAGSAPSLSHEPPEAESPSSSNRPR